MVGGKGGGVERVRGAIERRREDTPDRSVGIGDEGDVSGRMRSPVDAPVADDRLRDAAGQASEELIGLVEVDGEVRDIRGADRAASSDNPRPLAP